jgi:hypothetical protein
MTTWKILDIENEKLPEQKNNQKVRMHAVLLRELKENPNIVLMPTRAKTCLICYNEQTTECEKGKRKKLRRPNTTDSLCNSIHALHRIIRITAVMP